MELNIGHPSEKTIALESFGVAAQGPGPDLGPRPGPDLDNISK